MTDKLKHFILCHAVASVFGWQIALTVALTIEFTQAEYGNADVKTFLRRLGSKDTILDILADLTGIGFALIMRWIIC